MTTWKHCNATSFWPGDESACEVRIDGPEIVVSYLDEGRWLNYKGHEVSLGHFELTCAEVGGNASLHRTGDGEWLEGFWVEQGDAGMDKGMWRIHLSE